MSGDAVSSRCTAQTVPLCEPALQDWLDGPVAILHGWSPQVDDLQDAVRCLSAHACSRHLRVLDEGDLLPLLHQLNQQLAAIPDGARAEQLWVLARADRMAQDQLDLLRRVVLHYPELRIRMAWFSLTAQPPAAPDGVHVLAVPSRDAQPVPDTVLRLPRSARLQRRSALWLGGAALVAMAGALVGLGARGPVGQEAATAVPAAPAASVPASGALQAPVVDPDAPAASAAMPDPMPQEPVLPSSAAGAASAVPHRVSAAGRWLQGLPEGSLLVVHAQVSTLAQAQTLRSSESVLANAQILMAAQEASAARYLVVTGPFRSAERAHNYMQRLAWKAYARSVSREELLAQTGR